MVFECKRERQAIQRTITRDSFFLPIILSGVLSFFQQRSMQSGIFFRSPGTLSPVKPGGSVRSVPFLALFFNLHSFLPENIIRKKAVQQMR